MMTELRPHVARATGHIESVTPSADGGYIVLTRVGYELFDATLAPVRVIRGALGSPTLLADGRMVSTATREIIAPDDTISKFEGFDRDTCKVLPSVSGDGFFAINPNCVVVDRRGEREVCWYPETYLQGVDAWSDGLALAGSRGLLLLDARGAELARSPELYLTGSPFALGSRIVAAGLDCVHVLDEHAQPVGELDLRPRFGGLRRFGDGLLAEVDDGATLAHLGLDAGALAVRWRRRVGELGAVCVAGDRIVLEAEAQVVILDGDGAVRQRLPELRWLRGAHAFGGGLALLAQQLVWWRPGQDLVELPHDMPPTVVCPTPVGLATADADALCVWRTDLQGPAPEPLAHELPLGTPLVVEGALRVIEEAGRFSLRAHALGGTVPVPVAPGSRWRPLATREEAMRVVERLVARQLDGPAPELPAADRVDAFTRDLAQLPLSETVVVHGRAMFSPSAFPARQLALLSHARVRFFEELAAVLDTSPRALLTAIRAGTSRLEPPWPVPGHEHLGSFTTSGALTVADPTYVDRKTSAGELSLALRLTARAGTWHVFVRPCPGERASNAELVAVHERAADVRATRQAGSIGVDAGCAGVFDEACPRHDSDLALEEGIFGGLGAVVWTAWGDGMYPVFVGEAAGEVAKIRVVFDGDRPKLDRSVAGPATADAKPYSTATRFEVGDVIAHPKLGAGTVVRVAGEKIEVRFPDATRTLVHGKG